MSQCFWTITYLTKTISWHPFTGELEYTVTRYSNLYWSRKSTEVLMHLVTRKVLLWTINVGNPSLVLQGPSDVGRMKSVQGLIVWIFIFLDYSGHWECPKGWRRIHLRKILNPKIPFTKLFVCLLFGRILRSYWRIVIQRSRDGNEGLRISRDQIRLRTQNRHLSTVSPRVIE